MRQTGNADHVRLWTESNPRRDAFRQRGWRRASGSLQTEGQIMMTRDGEEGTGAAWTADEGRGKAPDAGGEGSSYLLMITGR